MSPELDEEQSRFTNIQAKLVDVFKAEGYDHIKAGELGFLMAQAIRDVPALLRLLDDIEHHSNDEIIGVIHDVLANRFALEEANRILLSPN